MSSFVWFEPARELKINSLYYKGGDHIAFLATANETLSMAEATTSGMQEGGEQHLGEQVQGSLRKKWTTNPAEGVDLIIGRTGLEAEAPTTVGRVFKDTVERIPDHPAHMYKENGQWKSITYKEYYNRCFAAAKSFLKVHHLASPL